MIARVNIRSHLETLSSPIDCSLAQDGLFFLITHTILSCSFTCTYRHGLNKVNRITRGSSKYTNVHCLKGRNSSDLAFNICVWCKRNT